MITLESSSTCTEQPSPQKKAGISQGTTLYCIQNVFKKQENLILIHHRFTSFRWWLYTHPEMFCEKGVFRNFWKFTGQYLCQSLFFNKVTGFRYDVTYAESKTLQLYNFVKSDQNATKLCTRLFIHKINKNMIQNQG